MSAGGDFVPWDPTKDKPTDTYNSAAEPRRALFDIRDLLQRAIIAGGQYNTVERGDRLVDPYVPAAAARHKVLSTTDSGDRFGMNADPDAIRFASNTATALLLSRQFESLSRKDILLEEQVEFNRLSQAFFQATRWRLVNAHNAAMRNTMSLLEDSRKREKEQEHTLALNIVQLEAACRARTEAAAEECRTYIEKELARVFDVIGCGYQGSQRHWVVQQEDRARHNVILEYDRMVSRIFGQQLSERQGLIIRQMLREKIPANPTELIDVTEAIEEIGRQRAAGASNINVVVDRASDEDAELYRKLSAAEALDVQSADGSMPMGAESECGSNFAPSDTFAPYWGWMFKSTGVLLTWQRRFFVFTRRGKMKFSTTDKGPWTTIFSASDILRVEIDGYHDGIRPPGSQYHQYGFYVDLYDSSAPKKQRRLRFCCYTRKVMTAWLTVLRHATDIIYSMEQSGSIPRAAHRAKSNVQNITKAVPILRNVHTSAPATYRKRTELEDDYASLVAAEKNRQEEERKEKLYQVAAIEPQGSPRFGRPPSYVGRVATDSPTRTL